MALENLEPATRIESILDGEDIAPATRLEYFLKQAASGGGSGSSALVVHFIRGADITTHLDCTYNEIVTAIRNNLPLIIYNLENNVYSFYFVAHVGKFGDNYAVILYDILNQSVLQFMSATVDGELVIPDNP